MLQLSARDVFTTGQQPTLLNMKITARTLLSATTAFGLTAFALFSAFDSGTSASVTATAVGLLVIYGLLEMAILTYSPRRTLNLRRTPARRVVPSNATVRVSALVEYPTCSTRARAA